MKIPSIFKPKAIAVAVVLAGVVLSHGCTVKGSSPDASQVLFAPGSPEMSQFLTAKQPVSISLLPS